MICIVVNTGRKQEAAFTDSSAEVTHIVPEVELTAGASRSYTFLPATCSLCARRPLLSSFVPVQLLVGGPGVFKADGRTHFGCLVSKRHPPLLSEEGALPVSF